MEPRRRTRRKSFAEFPQPKIDQEAVLKDTREMDFMSKFRDYHVRTVFYFALLGMTEEQMAVAFDISMGTLQAWKKKFPTFLESLRKGKEQADSAVVYSLYQAAVGYEHDSEQLFMTKEKEFDPVTGKLVREKPQVIRVPIVKRYPPNVKAALRWLEVRQPAQWSQKPDMHIKLAAHQHTIDLKGASMDDLKVLQKLIEQNNMQTTDAAFATTPMRQMAQLNSFEEVKNEFDIDNED